jgi:glycosyltransferase involved in cell wall biosynthesis
VADFRDPWMGNPFIKFPTIFHRQINQRLEQRVFADADRVILNTDVARQYHIKKYSNLPSTKFITIPNGYDQADIVNSRKNARSNPVFTIVHLGSLFRKTRSSEFFLRALHETFQAGKLPQNKICVDFIGSIDNETQGFVRQFELSENVELLGYLTHRQALSQLSAADLLLLIPSYGAGSELFVPAKLFEYLTSRKPILCLAESGACADLVVQARAGSIVSPTDTRKIADQLVRLYQQWENGRLEIDPDLDLIESFERHRLTGRLANLLTEICS